MTAVVSGSETGQTRIVARTVHRWPTYNLFCRHDTPDLVCAVPNDRPVPPFVRGAAWRFVGGTGEPAAAPPGFSARAAEHGVVLCGYHLFQRLPDAVPGRAAGLRRAADIRIA